MNLTEKPYSFGWINGPGDEAVSTRVRNKNRRKERILIATAELVCANGIDAVRLAKVAETSGVTVPTIHNLFGRKRDVLNRLVNEVAEWLRSFASVQLQTPSLESVEEGLSALFDFMDENAVMFKAGFLIGERFGTLGVEGSPDRGITALIIEKYERFLNSAAFHGELSAKRLAEFMNDQFRLQRSYWLQGRVPLAEFRRKVFWSFYVILLADAQPDMRSRLFQRLKDLSETAES